MIKLVRSPEIKRVIKAYIDAGGEFGGIDIRADGVTIYPPSQNAAGMTPYDKWKASREPRPARN